ncbi:MAG: nitrile hydratase subunit beta, partial [Pseudomonadales bacterium]
MEGIHDLGGVEGFGPVEPEENEPAFHERWEAQVFAINRALGRTGARANIDQFRHSIERIDPVAYLTHTYYGRWLGGIETMLVEAGVVTQDEINVRVKAQGGELGLIAARPSADPDTVPAGELQGARRPLDTKPRFAIGERVVTRNHAVPGHTRLPRYARGKVGTVVLYHDGWVYPDTNAHGGGENPQ